MAEDKNTELELNFGSGNPGVEAVGKSDELDAARAELAAELANTENDAEQLAAAQAEADEIAAAQTAADTRQRENPAPAGAGAIPRSRQPVNRPAGTPPLNKLDSGVAAPPPPAAPAAHQSYGAALRSLREQRHMSFKDLEKETLIQPRYLEAIESENLDALPPLVYVIAYIRTLCKFYKLGDDEAQSLVGKLKGQLECTCNDELLNTLEVDSSGAAVNERRLRRILSVAGGAIVLVLAGIGLVVYLALRSAPAAPPAGTGTGDTAAAATAGFDPNTLFPLLEPPTLELAKLPVAE